MSLYYNDSGYFTLRGRYPSVMDRLHRIVRTTTFHPGIDHENEIVPVIRQQHARDVAFEIANNQYTKVTHNGHTSYVTTELFVCTPNDFWAAVEEVANELDAKRREVLVDSFSVK